MKYECAHTRVCVFAPPPSELFYTERAHLRTLKVLDSVFYQRLKGEGILPPEDIKLVFINLEEIIQLHGNVFGFGVNQVHHTQLQQPKHASVIRRSTRHRRSSSPLVSVTEQMLVIRKRSETSVIGQIADDLLAWVRITTHHHFQDGNNCIYSSEQS